MNIEVSQTKSISRPVTPPPPPPLDVRQLAAVLGCSTTSCDSTIDNTKESPLLLSPSKRGKRRLSNSDRFIPERTNVIYLNAYQLNSGADDMFGSPTKPRKNSNSNTNGEYDSATEASNRVYSQVLKNEMFGPAYADRQPAPPSSSAQNHLTSPSRKHHQQPLLSPRKVLQFNSNFQSDQPMRCHRRLDFSDTDTPTTPPSKLTPRRIIGKSQADSPLNAAYKILPCSPLTTATLQQPRKAPRYISKIPFKVLDAPDLADDFYLNLVDWGAENILGVGLGSCVYLWSALTSSVTKLCDIGPYDAVTSVNWMHKGSHVAIGTNRGLVQI